MGSGISRFKQWVSKSTGTVFTLLILGLIGYLGHHTHWSFSGEHQQDHHAEHASLHTSRAVSKVAVHTVHYASAEAVRKSGIVTVATESKVVSEFVAANGAISYDKRRVARLSSRVAGTVWRMEKYLGDAVKAGDMLLIIEAVEIGRMKAEFLSALIATETNEESLKRLESTKDAIPEKQIRQARSELRASRIQLLNAEQALVNVGINVRMEEYQGLPETRQAEMIHFAGLPKKLAETLDPDTTTSSLVALNAPFDGVVTHGDFGIGEAVEPGKLIIQIADLSRMWIVLEVQKEQVHKLRVGQQIIFKTDGVPEELESQIAWISTEADESTRTLQVRAGVDNPIDHPDDPSATGQRLLRANTFGFGRILVRKESDAMVVPTECIQSDGINDLVFVKTGPIDFEARIVTVGIEEGNYTEIRGPVAIGDQVVQQGSHILKSQVLLSNSGSGTP